MSLYTKSQIDKELSEDLTQYYKSVRVATYAAYVPECAGPQKKIVTVAIDETDGNQTNNKYYYEGDNVVNPDPQF